MPPAVVRASKTIDGRAAIRRTSVRLLMRPPPQALALSRRGLQKRGRARDLDTSPFGVVLDRFRVVKWVRASRRHVVDAPGVGKVKVDIGAGPAIGHHMVDYQHRELDRVFAAL